MLSVEKYKNWFLPSLVKVPAWNAYLDALLDEIVKLQMYNMGSYNEWGFNGVEEDISLEQESVWMLGSEYRKTAGEVVGSGGFTLSGGVLSFTGAAGVENVCVLPYAFVKDRKYKVTFEVYDLLLSEVNIHVGMGGDAEVVNLNFGTSDPVMVELELLATDYYFQFGVSGDEGSFKIRNLKLVGVLNSNDEKERISVLRRLVNVDNASREILERMRDSLSFPSISGMPESLLRQVIKDHDLFVGYGGSELSAAMFFYFLGYEVDFSHLYAHKSDYNAQQFSYIAEKFDDVLESGVKVYGQVSENASASHVIKLKEGHQVIAGDFIADQQRPFNPIFIEVLSVNGLEITLEERVTVVQNDFIDIYRVYPYAVNPDPVNYMKTSHIDVFFKQKYSEDVNLDFNQLEQFFTRYLPVNVVIRFFGYRNDPEDEEFGLRESSFRFSPVRQEGLTLLESPTFPTQNYAHVVYLPTPGSHTDIYGNTVNGYSHVISHLDPASGNPVYVVVPLT